MAPETGEVETSNRIAYEGGRGGSYEEITIYRGADHNSPCRVLCGGQTERIITKIWSERCHHFKMEQPFWRDAIDRCPQIASTGRRKLQAQAYCRRSSGRDHGGEGCDQAFFLGPKVKKVETERLVGEFSLSKRKACRLLGLEQSTFYYRGSRQRDDNVLKTKITEICQKKVRYGRPRVVWYLREVEGMRDNHKRIGRVYRELGLQIGKRSKDRPKRAGLRLVLEKPEQPNEI